MNSPPPLPGPLVPPMPPPPATPSGPGGGAGGNEPPALPPPARMVIPGIGVLAVGLVGLSFGVLGNVGCGGPGELGDRDVTGQERVGSGTFGLIGDSCTIWVPPGVNANAYIHEATGQSPAACHFEFGWADRTLNDEPLSYVAIPNDADLKAVSVLAWGGGGTSKGENNCATGWYCKHGDSGGGSFVGATFAVGSGQTLEQGDKVWIRPSWRHQPPYHFGELGFFPTSVYRGRGTSGWAGRTPLVMVGNGGVGGQWFGFLGVSGEPESEARSVPHAGAGDEDGRPAFIGKLSSDASTADHDGWEFDGHVRAAGGVAARGDLGPGAESGLGSCLTDRNGDGDANDPEDTTCHSSARGAPGAGNLGGMSNSNLNATTGFGGDGYFGGGGGGYSFEDYVHVPNFPFGSGIRAIGGGGGGSSWVASGTLASVIIPGRGRIAGNAGSPYRYYHVETLAAPYAYPLVNGVPQDPCGNEPDCFPKPGDGERPCNRWNTNPNNSFPVLTGGNCYLNENRFPLELDTGRRDHGGGKVVVIFHYGSAPPTGSELPYPTMKLSTGVAWPGDTVTVTTTLPSGVTPSGQLKLVREGEAVASMSAAPGQAVPFLLQKSGGAPIGGGRYSFAYDYTVNGTMYSLQQPLRVLSIRGDLNGDQRIDVVWRNTSTGADKVRFHSYDTNPADGNKIRENEFDLLAIASQAFKIRSTGDLDGDGKSDILWTETFTADPACVGGGGMRVWGWLMNGNTILSGGTISTICDTNYDVLGTADLDGDGRMDIVLRYNIPNHSNNGMVVSGWLMNGLVIKSSATIMMIENPDNQWSLAATADIDNDGNEDVIWKFKNTDANSTEICARTMSGLEIRVDPWVQTDKCIGVLGDAAWEIAGVGDFDGDKRPDFLWRNYTGTSPDAEGFYIWYPDGPNGLRAEKGYSNLNFAQLPQKYRVVQVGDMDGDGLADIIFRDSQEDDTEPTDEGKVSYWKLRHITSPYDSEPEYGQVEYTTRKDLTWQIVP